MELKEFMDNIEFVFCDEELLPNSKDLFVRALHEGISCHLTMEELNKASEELQDEINLAPAAVLAKSIGNGVQVYFRAKYLLNFEYDTLDESWGFYFDPENADPEGVSVIPLIFMLLYNVLCDTLPTLNSYDKLEMQ